MSRRSLADYSRSSWLMYPRRDLVGRSCDLFWSGRQEQLGRLCRNRRDLPRRPELGVLACNGLTSIHVIDMLPGGQHITHSFFHGRCCLRPLGCSFLVLKEVVLTFDDGPWPTNTRAVLDALAQHCVMATFFPIGKRAVKLALGAPPAPFFRFPYLQDPKDQLAYLASRNIAIISHDMDSFDFKMRKPEDVIKSVMSQLERKGKGIILMHDFQQATARAMPDLLKELKAKGYKVVHMTAKAPVTTLAQWDDAAKSELKGAGVGTDRPTSSVVRTIEDNPVQSTAAPAQGTPKK